MKKYRKKPVVIEAMQFTDHNFSELCNWIGIYRLDISDGKLIIIIPTLEGDMTAKPNDWIIKGVQGEFYPCKPDIFEQTYESVESEDK
jgi:hypothetical protein